MATSVKGDEKKQARPGPEEDDLDDFSDIPEDDPRTAGLRGDEPEELIDARPERPETAPDGPWEDENGILHPSSPEFVLIELFKARRYNLGGQTFETGDIIEVTKQQRNRLCVLADPIFWRDYDPNRDAPPLLDAEPTEEEIQAEQEREQERRRAGHLRIARRGAETRALRSAPHEGEDRPAGRHQRRPSGPRREGHTTASTAYSRQ